MTQRIFSPSLPYDPSLRLPRAAGAAPEPLLTIFVPTLALASPRPFPSPKPLPSPTPTTEPEPKIQPRPSVSPFIPLQQAPLFAPPFAHPEPPCGWAEIAGQVFDAKAVR